MAQSDIDPLLDLGRLDVWDWPRDAGDRILAGLQSQDGEAQRAAAELAAAAVDDRIARALLALVTGDGPEELRGRAAVALGPALEECDLSDWESEHDHPPMSRAAFEEVQHGLEHAFHDEATPGGVRRRVLEAAVRAPQPWQREAVQRAYHPEDPEWCRTAVLCMGYLPGFENELLEAARSTDPLLRREAVRAAGVAGVEEAAPAVLGAAMQTEDRELRLMAIEALAGLQAPDAEDLLAELASSSDDEVAAAAEEVIETRLALADEDEDEMD